MSFQLTAAPTGALCYCGRPAYWMHCDPASEGLSSALCDRHVLLWLSRLENNTVLTVWPVEAEDFDDDDDGPIGLEDFSPAGQVAS